MKNIMLLLFALVAYSCQEDAAPTKPIDDNFDTSKATLIKDGIFMGVGHTVSGTAAIYELDGDHYVVLEPFSSQNGPDLKVYLSKDQGISEYVNLGAMKSTMGKQSYQLPNNVVVADYDHVLIWCQEFSVLFGKAEMM